MTDEATGRRRTRRANGEGSLYFDAKRQRWVAEVSVGQRPNGRPQRVSASGRTQKEVRARLTELREARPAAAPAPSVRLLSAALISWLAIRSARLRPRTRTNYEIYVRRHLIPLLGHLPLGAVSRQHIDEFISVLLTQPTARGRPLSPTTVGHAVAILQCVFKDFLAWEWIERNPLASVRKPRADRWQTQPWSVEECGRFLAICSAEWYGPAFATCLFAGLRVGEMGALTRADIDLQRGEIRVSRQLQKGKQGWEWSPPKSRAGLRVVSFDPAGPFGDLVRGQLARADELLLLGPQLHDRFDPTWLREGLVFTTRNGTPIENRQCSERLKKLCERHSLRYIRPHDLRHEFATLSLAAGVGIKTVSELMGHSSIAITADLYGHVLDESRRQASSLLNQLLTRQNVAGSRVLK